MLDFVNEKSIEHQRTHFRNWLSDNILKGKLSNFLSFLLSDTELLKNCYESSAFIRLEAYQNALMKCIQSIESNEQSHLSKIDVVLYEINKPGHRRSISQPYIPQSSSILANRKSILSQTKKNSRTFDYGSGKVKVSNLRRCKSLPNLTNGLYNNRPRSNTVNMRNLNQFKFQKKVSFKHEEKVPYFEYRLDSTSSTTSQKMPVPIHLVKVDDIKIHTDYRYSTEYKNKQLAISPASSNSSSKSSLTPMRSLFNLFESTSDARKMTSPEPSSSSPTEIFLTEAVVSGAKLRSHSTIAAPNLLHQDANGRKKKTSRQNLAQYIHMINNSHHKVELERENAHFHLSEAIIAQSEQLKWNKIFDEKYKIPRDCRIKQSLSHPSQKTIQPPAKIRHNTKFTIGSVDDDTESSLSSDEVSVERSKSSTSSEDITETIPQMEWTSTIDSHSAEGIAIALLSKFNKQKCSSTNGNFLWLVNESQAPQQLLPLPDSYPINPDDTLSYNSIRGSSVWAPPRQQIIFTVHPPPDRKLLMLQQNHRCAGCGIKIAPAYIHKLRYCDYIGKYFCTACHKMQVSVIPARVLDKWDFTLNPVSNFAYKWLDQLWNCPLFHVSDLNATLYQKVKQLTAARESRLKLKYVSDFIKQCRFAADEKEIIQRMPPHWTADVDIWCMVDFMNVKNSTFTNQINEIISQFEKHIIENKCEVID